MATLADVQQSLSQQAHGQLTNRALTSAAQIGVGALGAGMAGRGLMGMLQQLRRQHITPQTTIPSPIEVEIPVEELREDEKTAGIIDGAINSAAKGVSDFGKGEYASTPAGLPWATPLWITAGLGGLGAGWKLTDYLMDKRRKQHQKSEFDAAKSEYHDALYGKTAELLDQLFDLSQEKQSAESIGRTFVNPYGGIPDYGTAQTLDPTGDAIRTISNGELRTQRRFPGGMQAPQRPPLAPNPFEPGPAVPSTSRPATPAARPAAAATQPRPAPLPPVANPFASAKQASEEFQPSSLAPGNLAGMAGGLAATWAGGSGLLAALSTYNAMKKRQRKSLLSAAQEQRRRQRYEAQPTPVYATPVPVSIMDAEDEAKPFRAAPSLR